MGKLYQPCIIGSGRRYGAVIAWLSQCEKMMEHAYIDNKNVGAFEWLISPEGPHHKSQVVWACEENLLWEEFKKENEAHPKGSGANYQFIVNHNQRCYIDKNKIKGGTNSRPKIHPLPLLTAQFAGGGWGDYGGTNIDLLGSWVYDTISVEKSAPKGLEEVYYDFRDERYEFPKLPVVNGLTESVSVAEDK